MCTYENHAEIKADPERFNALPFYAYQCDDEGRPELVYRACVCGSHLCRPVFAHAEIEAAALEAKGDDDDGQTETR